MKFSLYVVAVPLALLGTVVPASASFAAGPAGADGGAGGTAPPVLRLTDGPADKAAVAVTRPSPDGSVATVPVGDARLTARGPSGGLVLAPARSPAGNGPVDLAQVHAGDVVAGPATQDTPHGVLVKVAAVHANGDGSIAVDTVPATLADALGDAEVDATVPLTPGDLKAKPLTSGGKVTAGAGPQGRGVRLDVDVPVPDGVEPTEGHASALSASLDLSPEFLFSYERAHWYGVQPSRARIGMAADYQYGVKVHAKSSASYATGHKPLRIPAAEVNVDKTVWLGPVPIVLSLKVDYFYDVSADGTIAVDAEEHTDGRLEIGARYDAGEGWSALSGPEPVSTATPALITGSATAKGGVGSHAQVGLYGSVGVAADAEPYLKATATAQNTPQGASAGWGLYAGLEVNGSFFARLDIFGTRVLDKDWELPPLRYEHKLAGSDV
ncbi:hypothetical protein ACFY97_04125 [Streptomyces klenkii]|uniref:hypothetical protein n=1 Tax=Streptomyces klenkii TaxID=1420899 RepID=UPI0036E4F7DC